MKKFSTAVNKYVTELGTKQASKQLPEEDQSVMIAELERRNSQLSGMVTNYKRIIEDTVCTMLDFKQGRIQRRPEGGQSCTFFLPTGAKCGFLSTFQAAIKGPRGRQLSFCFPLDSPLTLNAYMLI